MSVVLIHVKVVPLERVSIGASIDRPQTRVFSRVILAKADDHLVGSDMGRVKDSVLAVVSQFYRADIRRVRVTPEWDLSVEEEFQRCLAPRRVSELSSIELAPCPVILIRRHLGFK